MSSETLSNRKMEKELEKARQAGTAPPAIDVNTDKMINPHNPNFLVNKPWYLGGNDEGPTLDHQKRTIKQEEEEAATLTRAEELLAQQRRRQRERLAQGKFAVGMWVEALKKNKPPYRIGKIVKMNPTQTEFDIEFEDGTVERNVKYSRRAPKPRIRITQLGARALSDVKETYDSKRDQYHGYDSTTHNQKLAIKYQEREEMRRKAREQNLEQQNEKQQKDSDFDDDSDLDSQSEDEFAQRDEDAKVMTTRVARQGGVGGAQMKITARNLRIREDTAKYLRNLDPNSAYYDPKSRSMRDNPNPEIAQEEAQFAGDNFTRISGQAVEFAQSQMFAWEAADKGVEVHPQANPSQAELMKKQFQSKASELKRQQQKAVLEKYGGAEYLDGGGGLASAVEDTKLSTEERKIRFGISVAAHEYSRDGRLVNSNGREIKHQARPSKYEEDVFINGHTTVWGSFFHIGAFSSGSQPWGYADDHSLLKNSYCTGENGRMANDEANEMRFGTGKAGSAALAQARGMLKAVPAEQRGNDANAHRISRSKLYGEADQAATIDEAKVKEALERAKSQQEKTNGDRKRKYNSVDTELDVTEEDMEAYRLIKDRKSDPMANINSDKLLDY